MLTNPERIRIYQQAYLPEHLPDYVTAVSAAQPHLISDHLCLYRQQHLVFIGYPLGNPDAETPRVYEAACKLFQPSTVAIIAPTIWFPEQTYVKQPPDHYYRLNLPLDFLNPAVTYMVRRAERELVVNQGQFSKEHKKLVQSYLRGYDLRPAQKYIFTQIPRYLKISATARLLEARKKKALVAFTVVDVGSADYAFYLFNFRSDQINVPGASDLLFREMVKLTQAEGKKAINLGLGVHAGIRHFKEKWGGVPFCSHASAYISREPMVSGRLVDKL